MKVTKVGVHVVWVLLVLFFCGGAMAMNAPDASPPVLHVFGKITNQHGQGIEEAKVELFKGKELVEPLAKNAEDAIVTMEDGSYQGQFPLSEDELQSGNAARDYHLVVTKAGFTKVDQALPQESIEGGTTANYANENLVLKRSLTPAFWIATIVFIAVYVLISFEWLHRTVAAMLGASIMLVVSYTLGTIDPAFHIMSYENAIASIDNNVILLLLGMMCILGIFKHTGIFQWCAMKCFKLANGNVLVLAGVLMVITAVFSAFLDNVTTMLLIAPITIEIALTLSMSPLALLLPEIFASNVGGTATLIGDPPNIMIGSFAHLSFLDFLGNLGPVCIIAIVFLIIYVRVIFAIDFKRAVIEDVQTTAAQMREKYKITDGVLLTVGLIIIAIVVFFFLSHSLWHMEVCVSAIAGAALLLTFALLTKRVEFGDILLKEVDWSTLLFFMFLFILVGGVKEVGLLDVISDWVLRVSSGHLTVAICLILWVSAIMSAFVDNIPFTATMLPIVGYLSQTLPGGESGVLWWALAFGACFGGNGTMIGASANVVTMGIAESRGYKLGFIPFMKMAFPFMLGTVIIANIWLLLRY